MDLWVSSFCFDNYHSLYLSIQKEALEATNRYVIVFIHFLAALMIRFKRCLTQLPVITNKVAKFNFISQQVGLLMKHHYLH